MCEITSEKRNSTLCNRALGQVTDASKLANAPPKVSNNAPYKAGDRDAQDSTKNISHQDNDAHLHGTCKLYIKKASMVGATGVITWFMF